MTSSPEHVPEPVAPRRRTFIRWARMAIVALALVAGLFASHWLTLSQAQRDAEIIRVERARRFGLATSGLTLPDSPLTSPLAKRLAAQGLRLGAPVLIRLFKREFELELWMAHDGVFVRFATYPICMWSGQLGPKLKTGDHQSPEGFYTVAKGQLNPNSKYHRSFNLGFPNAFDRAHSRTGSFLMVHGACASVGCYAMTNGQMDDIWTLVTAALDAGQPAFQVQAYPFRMSEDNLRAYQGHPAEPFWRDLAQGYAIFERTGLPPRVNICGGRYRFAPGLGVAPALADDDYPRCIGAAAKT